MSLKANNSTDYYISHQNLSLKNIIMTILFLLGTVAKEKHSAHMRHKVLTQHTNISHSTRLEPHCEYCNIGRKLSYGVMC